MSITEFVTSVLTDKSNKQKKFLLNLIERVEAENIEVKTNINLKNYKRTMDNFGVKHTFKKHRNAQTEASRGQMAIEIADFSHIPSIVSEPDDIIFGAMNDMGNSLIQYIKAIEKFKYFYIEEIRTGRKEIVLQTFYKRAVKKKIRQRESTDFDIS